MQRIDTPNRALSLWGAGKDGWKDGSQAAGINATELDAAFFNAVQEELAAFPESIGVALDPNNRGQVLAAVLHLIEARAGNYALDTGVANAYVVALNPVVAAINGDYTFRVKIANANTGASTINFGAGPVALVNDVGAALQPADLPAGGVISVSYVQADNKAYITSLVPSQAITQAQADARYILSSNETTAASDPGFADNSTKVASTNWIRGAMSAIATAAGFAISLTANGYIKLPSWLGGLIFQWGMSGTYSPGTTNNMALPVAYPTGGFCAIAIPAASSTTSASSPSVTGYTATTYITIYANQVVSCSYLFFSIGR